jgi:hypothetical protein
VDRSSMGTFTISFSNIQKKTKTIEIYHLDILKKNAKVLSVLE